MTPRDSIETNMDSQETERTAPVMSRRRHILRRRLFVDRFQTVFLLVNLVHFMAIICVFSLLVLWPLVRDLQAEPSFSHTKANAATAILAFHANFWPACVILLLALGLHSVVVLHRVAGPLHSFRRTFRKAAQKDLSTRVRIRYKDYLHEDEKCINEMLDSFRGWIREVGTHCEHAVASLDELERALPDSTDERAQTSVQGLHKALEALKSGLDEYRLEPVPVPAPDHLVTAEAS